jgi:hypothetical protein
MKGDLSSCLIVLCLGVPSFVAADIDPPQQIHLAAATPSSIRVSWKTESTLPSQCIYADNALLESGTTKMGDDGEQYLANHGYHHTVLFTDLPQDSVYYYQCGDGTPDNTSPIIEFNTPPSSDQTVNLAIFGDWGYLDSEQRPVDLALGGLERNWTATLTRELLEKLKDDNAMDLVYITGDIGYADDAFSHVGFTLHDGYEPCYDGWMQWQQNYSSIMPLMVAPGNHESECHDVYCLDHLHTVGQVLNNFTAYNARFQMPSSESNGRASMWYSYDWGPVHITSINTETDFDGAGEEFDGDSNFKFLPAGSFGNDGEYMAWVESDLAKASQDPNIKWIIAGGHRPFEDLPEDNSDQLISLFLKYNVSFYFAGHGHSYNRHDISDWGDQTIHIMAGGAGNDETLYPSDQFDDVENMKENKMTASESCDNWCQSPYIQQMNMLHGGEDPCRHCHPNKKTSNGLSNGNGKQQVPDPVFFTDKMSIGVLKATDTTLEWNLLRAPDGLVLDSVSISK